MELASTSQQLILKFAPSHDPSHKGSKKIELSQTRGHLGT